MVFSNSTLHYGLLLWEHSSHVHDIILLQKKCILELVEVGFLKHCRPLFLSLKIYSVINVYVFQIFYTKTNIQTYTYWTCDRVFNITTHGTVQINNTYTSSPTAGPAQGTPATHATAKIHYDFARYVIQYVLSKLAAWNALNLWYKIWCLCDPNIINYTNSRGWYLLQRSDLV